MGNGIGGHTKPNKGENDTWLTPRQLLYAVGSFDLDPCAAPTPRPWPTAQRHIELPEDGLADPWQGRVWLNPPYSTAASWLEKMAFHRNGTALIFARTETEMWQKWVWPFADSVLFIAGRLYFCFPDGSRAPGNAGGPSALIAYTPEDTEILRGSGIAGSLVQVLSSTRIVATCCI